MNDHKNNEVDTYLRRSPSRRRWFVSGMCFGISTTILLLNYAHIHPRPTLVWLLIFLSPIVLILLDQIRRWALPRSNNGNKVAIVVMFIIFIFAILVVLADIEIIFTSLGLTNFS